MKKFYSTVMILAMMVAAVGLIACGGDDEDEIIGGNDKGEIHSHNTNNEGDEGGGSEGNNMEGNKGDGSSWKSTLPNGKRLVKMNKNNQTSYYYTYDNQGRIVKIEQIPSNAPNNKTEILITYSFNCIIREEYKYEGDKKREIRKIEYIISDGLLIRTSESDGYLLFKYDDNDYMVEETKYGTKYDWDYYGNLVSIMRDYSYYSDYFQNEIFYYTFSKYIDYNGFITGIIGEEEAVIGYIGKCSKYLPLKIKWKLRRNFVYNVIGINEYYTYDNGKKTVYIEIPSLPQYNEAEYILDKEGYTITMSETNYEWSIEGGLPIKLVTYNKSWKSNNGGTNWKKESSTIYYTFEWE